MDKNKLKYYDNKIDEIYSYLNTSEKGLNDKEASALLSKNGMNLIPKKEKDNIFKIYFNEFNNPIELILVVSVILSFIANEVIDAIVLIVIILIDTIMGAYQEWKAKKEAESLLNMIKETTTVVRNGIEKEIDSSNLVIGDIILLESGDKINADARIIECHNLGVDESPLTGESINIIKDSKVLQGSIPLADRTNMVYAGTTVTTGRAKAIVTANGINTELGKIAKEVIETKEEKSPLTIRTEKFSKQISVLIIIIAIVTTTILIIKGYPAKDIFLCVVALSISAMPEGLPLALTMALTIASKRMAKKNVIVKNLNAVESLGSCTIIASDKTGTLTLNEQTAKEILLPNGDTFLIEGTGYNNQGKIIPVDNAKLEDAKEIAFLGAINNEAHLHNENNKWLSFGDSIDIAFLCLAEKLSVNERPIILEKIPYESVNQYSAVFYKKDDEIRCTVKGSLEKILSFSKDNKKYYEQNEYLTSKGYRVIAIADGKVTGTKDKDIRNLQFKGLVAFIDPIREEVKNSIKECISAGIKVVMITGDHPLTALAIAKELELCSNNTEVATGEDIERNLKLGQKSFDKFVSCIKVFSRVTPLQKLEIINSYKRLGEFVAVTGDGVNDAPAIKAANIGIAMGSGTDVAKETASMIITDDNFSSIVSGIKEGRTAYSNIRKITLFLISCGLAEVLFFILSIAFGYPIPLLAIQLLWLNMVTDGLQDISLSFEKTEKNIMKEKPRDTKESLFSKDLMLEVFIIGFSISLIIFIAWKTLLDNGNPITYSRTIILMLMVFIQNFNTLNCRSEKKFVLKTSLFDNPLIIITVVGSTLLQIIINIIPETSKFLGILPLDWPTILKLLIFSVIIIFIFDLYKLVIYFIENKHKKK